MNTLADWTEYALIAEPAIGEALAPLCRNRSPLELPWGDGLLIEAQLRQAADAGVKRVEVVVRRASAQLRDRLQGGRPWGMTVWIVEDPAPWRFVDDTRLLRRAFPGVTTALIANLHPEETGRWFRQTHPSVWEGPTHERAVAVRVDLASSIAATTGLLRRETPRIIDTPRQLLDGNLALLKQPAGDIVLLREVVEELHLSREASVPSLDRFAGANLVDAGAFVDADVVGLTDCVVGKNVVIGAGARLERCLLMAGSAVGADLHLQDMVIDGQTIIDLSSNTTVVIDDIDLLPVPSVRTSSVPWSERFLAGFLLLLGALPAALLWLLARVSGRVASITERRFVPSGRSLTGEQLWTAIDLSTLVCGERFGVHRLFWLAAVVRGVIRLRGDALPPTTQDATIQATAPRFGVFAAVKKMSAVGRPMARMQGAR